MAGKRPWLAMKYRAPGTDIPPAHWFISRTALAGSVKQRPCRHRSACIQFRLGVLVMGTGGHSKIKIMRSEYLAHQTAKLIIEDGSTRKARVRDLPYRLGKLPID